jgi:hypothetical protein
MGCVHAGLEGSEPGDEEVVGQVVAALPSLRLGEDGQPFVDHAELFVQQLQVAAHLLDGLAADARHMVLQIAVAAAGVPREVLQRDVVSASPLVKDPVLGLVALGLTEVCALRSSRRDSTSRW